MKTGYQRIMVGVDAIEGDSISPLLVAYETASKHQALLVMVFVYDSIGYSYVERTDPKGIARIQKEATSRLELYKQQALAAGVPKVETVFAHGKPKRVLGQILCQQWSIDLLMIGQSNQFGIDHLFYNNMPRHLTKKAKCRVQIVTPLDLQQVQSTNVIAFPLYD